MSEDSWQERFGGLARLFGAAALERLRTAHIAVIGIGGVGSWSVEALARSGVGEISLIDLDDVCVTNVNRQLHAIDGQIGRPKVDAMAQRIARIDPDCRIHAVAEFFTKDTAGSLLEPRFDCVIDAIDSVAHKCVLIDACGKREIPIIVAGGAGGKRDPACVSTDDLFYATNDRLLRQVRKKLRAEYGFPPEPLKEPFGIRAVFSTENAMYPWSDGTICDTPEPGSSLVLDCESGFGTASFVTGTFGLTAAAEAVRLVVNG